MIAFNILNRNSFTDVECLYGLKSLYLALSQRVTLYLALSQTLCVLSPDEHANLSLGEHATCVSSFVVVYVCVVCMVVLQLAL